MSKHNHDTCEHDLKYCRYCDVVYCTKCDREWGGHNHWTWYWGGIPYRVTWSDTGYAVYTTSNTPVTDQTIINAFNAGSGEWKQDTTHEH